MSGQTRRSPVEHSQSEAQRADYYSAENAVRDTIDQCARMLGRAGEPRNDPDADAYAAVARECLDTLVPLLRQLTGRRLTGYGRDIGEQFDHRPRSIRWLLAARPRDFDASDSGALQRTARAFRSLAAIAQHEEIVADELHSHVDVEGFSLKLGEHLQDWDMDLGDPVGGITDDVEALKTLHCGGTGDGKSTALEREAMDFYQQTHRDGRDYKLVDLVDIDKGENWFYDIPQQQPALRRIREEELDLPPSFDEAAEVAQPGLEILVPLTSDLDRQPLPYDTADETFVAQPFTIPAASLPKRILVPCIMSRLSDDQEQTVRQAYDDVNRRERDWSLADLATEIRSRDELSPKHKADAIGVIRSLQDIGFIRTADSEYTLDWRDLFQETKTVTIFSQATLDSELGKFLCIAYLVDRILDIRQDLYGLPDCVLLMRELWEVTPQRGRLSPDERAAAVQEALANRMGKVMRKLRHFDLHLIADTQEPGDLHKQVREMFNRYVVFSATRDTIDDIFSWTSNDRKGAFWGTMNQETGKAGIVGKVQPAVEERDIEFLSPVAYAPPSHHHYDKARDTNGWRTRAAYIEREEVRRPADVGVDWPTAVPDELAIGEVEQRDGPDPNMRPVAAFAHDCLRVVDDGEFLFTAQVQDAFNAYMKANDREPWDFTQQSKLTTLGTRLREYYPDDTIQNKERRKDGDKHRAYAGITFSEHGRKIANQS